MPTQVDLVRSWLRENRMPAIARRAAPRARRSAVPLRRQGAQSTLALAAAEVERQRTKEHAGAR